MFRFIRLAISALITILSIAFSSTTLDAEIIDDFSSFDAGTWTTAPYATQFVTYQGLPQTLLPTTLDGNGVVRMTTISNSNLIRRGFGTVDTFDNSVLKVEVDFKTMPFMDNSVPAPNNSNIDGLLELMFVNPTTNDYAMLEIFSGNFGTTQASVIRSSLDSTQVSPLGIWDYDTYYRYVVESDEDSTYLSFRDATDNELFGHTYGFSLSDLGDYHIALAQRIGPAGYYSDVALDRFVATTVIPEPSTYVFWVLGLLAFGVCQWHKGRRTARTSRQ